MGYKVNRSGNVIRTQFPKQLSAAQIKQIENTKVNTTAIEKALANTKHVTFRGRATLV